MYHTIYYMLKSGVPNIRRVTGAYPAKEAQLNQKQTYSAIFLTSAAYAPLLSLWQRKDPIGFANSTWLQVVIGVGYVLLFLRLLLDPKAWLKVCCAFFLSCLPIIARSLLHETQRNQRLHRFNGGD